MENARLLKPGRAERQAGAFLAIALWLVNLRSCEAQLSVSAAAFNPFAGQGVPPGGIPASQFPVPLFVGTTNLVSISESAYTFTANIYLLMYYVDNRTLPMILSNYTSCSFYCSSRMSTVQNEYGQPACCDGVYIPQAYVINGVEFLEQTFPYRYLVAPYPGDLVVYYTQLQATFSAPFDYRSYPFDTHYLNIDLMTDYFPVLPSQTLSGAGFSATDGVLIQSQFEGTGDPIFRTGAYRPSLTNVDCAGWILRETWMDVMNWTVHSSPDAHKHHDEVRSDVKASVTGIRVYLKIVRASRVFYFVILILPTALIVFFSFVIFGFPMTSHKARIQLIITLFLTLIILQFTLQQFLPGTFTLISPVYLVLLSYIYAFILLVISVLSANLLQQCKRREKAAMRKRTCTDYQKFKAALLADAQRVAPRQTIREQGTQRILQMLTREGPSLARPHDAVTSPILDDGDDAAKPAVAGPESTLRAESEVTADSSELLLAWYHAQQNRWLFRKCGPIRSFVLWYRFIALPESHAYMEHLVHRIEVVSRQILFWGYLAAAGLIFGIAAARDDPSYILYPGPRT